MASRKPKPAGKTAAKDTWTSRITRRPLWMGAGIAVVVVAVVVVLLFALGPLKGSGTNRAELARQTERTYWNDFDNLKTGQAYMLLTPGVQQQISQKDYYQSELSLLESTHGVNALVGKATVVGDCAQVQISLITPSAPGQRLKAWQHLYWINGGWHISDSNGEITRTYRPLTSCPTGT